MAIATTDENTVDLDELRARLVRMSDAKLTEFGKAAAYVCRPAANFGKPPREVFVVQLKEARAEFRRRQQIKAGAVLV